MVRVRVPHGTLPAGPDSFQFLIRCARLVALGGVPLGQTSAILLAGLYTPTALA